MYAYSALYVRSPRALRVTEMTVLAALARGDRRGLHRLPVVGGVARRSSGGRGSSVTAGAARSLRRAVATVDAGSTIVSVGSIDAGVPIGGGFALGACGTVWRRRFGNE